LGNKCAAIFGFVSIIGAGEINRIFGA